MEVLPLAATPPSPAAPALTSRIDIVQEVLERETERRLGDVDREGILTGAALDVSPTGRLLSAAAEIADAADAAQAGATIDNGALIDETQRFVDSVNTLSLSGQVSPETLFDVAAELPVVVDAALLATEAAVALGSPQSSFVLLLDADILETALATDAVAATGQLAALAGPVAEAVAEAVAETAATSFVLSPPPLTVAVPPAEQTPLVEAAAAIPLPIPIVPDLTLENARLRAALADIVLLDIVASAAELPQPLPELQPEERDSLPRALQSQLSDRATADTAGRDTPVPIREAAAVPLNAGPADTRFDAAGLTIPNLLTAVATAQEATLTPADLVGTPLELIARLARNPAVAGAVAAFQIPADDGSRMRAPSPPETVVNPVEAVAATDAIGPELANNANQRRDHSPNASVSQWLATRPGLA